MPDPNVQRWKQRGTIAMWKNRSGGTRGEWNIAADVAGCDALLELLTLMEDGQWSSKKQLDLTKADQTPDYGRDDSFRSAIQLTIKYPKDSVPDGHWQLTENNRMLLLEVGLNRLRELREAIKDMGQGGGDYRIGGDDNPPWIWWWLND